MCPMRPAGAAETLPRSAIEGGTEAEAIPGGGDGLVAPRGRANGPPDGADGPPDGADGPPDGADGPPDGACTCQKTLVSGDGRWAMLMRR